MIYIGLPQWSHPKWVRLAASPALKSTPATLTAWRATPPCMRYQSRRLSPAGIEQTHDDFRFCFKFPATISHQGRPAPLRRVKQRIFCPPGAPGLAHRPVLAAAAGDVRSTRSPPRYGIFSTDCRRISPTASKFVIEFSRQRGSGTAAQPQAARA